ncbi:hypothetical protein [uncultured Tenacibaculum sp.]|uniref:hypothetical protein n=1 Tax=uncultured Tenacibaculum sp. TaxID=174713 RepID=UPI002620AC55|nr:hypothetical protein [uncultured Tenacibaculum sp.]
MTDNFFDFIMDTTCVNFTSSQKEVFDHSNYDPYSDDLNIIEEFLDKNELSKAIEYNSINLILSPRAHLYKNFALDKMNNQKGAQAELIFAQKIMEGISLTGNGTKEMPYIVTRISDEKDMLRYFQEEFKSQSLVKNENKIFDLIQCQSGKKIYFDITRPYLKMQELMNNGKIESPLLKMISENKVQQKKWWEFWK